MILLIVIPIIIIALSTQVYALYHLFNRNPYIADQNMQMIWVAIIVVGSLLGALTYFLAVKSMSK